jgi:ABC-2 type transport system ATP-binding protein
MGLDLHALAGLPGVAMADRHGESVTLHCTDADAALRALLSASSDAHDIEVRGAELEDAFLELTVDGVGNPVLEDSR